MLLTFAEFLPNFTGKTALTPPPGRGKHQWTELAPLQAEGEIILADHWVKALVQVTYQRLESVRQRRKYKDRPTPRLKSVMNSRSPVRKQR
jgi:hypothetical protein